MPRILIMSRKNAEKYAKEKHDDKSVVISISTPGDDRANIVASDTSNIKDVLLLAFNDTDSKEPEFSGISERQADLIAGFVEDNKDTVDEIIVHCDAGQSRSAGVAAAILYYLTAHDEEIFDNPLYKPNMLCYRRVLNALMHY